MSSPQNCRTAGAIPLNDDDAAAYGALLSRLVKHFSPVGEDERALVQSIVDADWRLGRIPALEAGIYAVGRLEFAALYSSEEDASARRQLVDAKIFLTYQRPLNNLSVQEARLRRQREKDVKALRELQEARNAHTLPAAAQPLSTGQALPPADRPTQVSRITEPPFSPRLPTAELVPANR